MQIDLKRLREHYGALSDEALAAIDSNQLVDAARRCYDEEIARRGLAVETDWTTSDEARNGEAVIDSGLDFREDEAPAWLGDAACACSFTQYPGQVVAPEAAKACEVLRAAGIPCHLAVKQPSPGDTPPVTEYNVLVPGAVNLHAVSILDRDLFNETLEQDWRTHLAGLSDKELSSLDPKIFCAGLLDRVKRLTTAYKDEIGRRKAEEGAAGAHELGTAS